MLIQIQPPQVSHVDVAEPDALFRQRALPVRLVRACACSRRAGCSATRGSRRRSSPPACRGHSWHRRGVHEPASAMGAHVVVGRDRHRPRAHDEDRVVENVVGEVVADLGDVLDAARLLPDLAPEPVALRPGIVHRDVGFHRDGHRLGQLLHRLRHRRVTGAGSVAHGTLPFSKGQSERRNRRADHGADRLFQASGNRPSLATRAACSAPAGAARRRRELAPASARAPRPRRLRASGCRGAAVPCVDARPGRSQRLI